MTAEFALPATKLRKNVKAPSAGCCDGLLFVIRSCASIGYAIGVTLLNHYLRRKQQQKVVNVSEQQWLISMHKCTSIAGDEYTLFL